MGLNCRAGPNNGMAAPEVSTFGSIVEQCEVGSIQTARFGCSTGFTAAWKNRLPESSARWINRDRSRIIRLWLWQKERKIPLPSLWGERAARKAVQRGPLNSHRNSEARAHEKLFKHDGQKPKRRTTI
jgi:hypothetical protein